MFTTTAPRPGPPDGADGPYLRAVVAREIPRPAAVAGDPEQRARLRSYVSDLARPFGVPLDEAMLAGPHGQSYGEMGAALLRDVLPPGAEVDLLVLAFAVPDIRPGRAAATYLSHVCPGNPFAFAVCDQGAAAAFTGLRLIREYARDAACPRAVLLVVEQASLPHAPAGVAAVPARHAGAALWLGPDGPARLGDIGTRAGVDPATARAVLDAPAGTTLIAGSGLEAHAPQHPHVRFAPADLPHTGLWAALADALRAAPPGARIHLADYDPGPRYLCTSTVDVGEPIEPRGDARDAGTIHALELGATR